MEKGKAEKEKMVKKIEQIMLSMLEDFPELKGAAIPIKIKKKTDYLMAISVSKYQTTTRSISTPIFTFKSVFKTGISIIKVDWFMRKASDEAIIGCLAHEMVHLVDSKKGFNFKN